MKEINVLFIHGYRSTEYNQEEYIFNNTKVNITFVPLGAPVLLKRKLKKIIKNYDLDSYDLIYALSMSSNIVSLVDDKIIDKLHIVVPFFLNIKTIFALRKESIKDTFGSYFLMLVNGRLGVIDDRLRVTIAEFDNVADNKYFINKYKQVNILKNETHDLTREAFLKILDKDLSIFR